MIITLVGGPYNGDQFEVDEDEYPELIERLGLPGGESIIYKPDPENPGLYIYSK